MSLNYRALGKIAEHWGKWQGTWKNDRALGKMAEHWEKWQGTGEK